MSLFDTVKDDDVLEELKNLDVGNMTPIDALNTIYRLQNKLKEPLVKVDKIKKKRSSHASYSSFRSDND